MQAAGEVGDVTKEDGGCSRLQASSYLYYFPIVERIVLPVYICAVKTNTTVQWQVVK